MDDQGSMFRRSGSGINEVVVQPEDCTCSVHHAPGPDDQHSDPECPYYRGPRPDPGENRTSLRHHAGDTEIAAAARAWPSSGTRRRQILAMVIDAGPNGLTCKEVSTKTGWPMHAISPRFTELRKGQWIRDVGARRGGGIVWVYERRRQARD